MVPTYEECRHNSQCFGGSCDDCGEFEPVVEGLEGLHIETPLESIGPLERAFIRRAMEE